VVKPFDWSYTTDYKGTVAGKAFASDNEPIPIALLRLPDPILFFEEVVLYESELDDNGISIFSVKVRVMPERMLLLCRLFMRLDNVIVRIRDTRVYVDFKAGKVTRVFSSSGEVRRGDAGRLCLYIFTDLCELTAELFIEPPTVGKIT
jgi:type 2A phosphatase activator TIP41